MRLALIALALLAASCGGDDQGGGSDEQALPAAASLIPVAPAPQPTPTPVPEEPSDDPLPATPSGGGGGGTDVGTCGAPVPPPITQIALNTFSSTVLDSTPLVGWDPDYCRLIGYTDGRGHCPVRPAGHPERLACETVGVGYASDTGRAGPTWTANDRPCDDSGAAGSCTNHPSNQFMVIAVGPGTFRACARNGVCGQITVK